MHGLAGHGTEEMGSAHAAMSSMTSAVASTAGNMTRDIAETASTVLVATTSHDRTGGIGMGMSTTGMCLAVLLLTFFALLVHWHASRLRPVPFLVARPARAALVSRREPDPPNLYVLSVQRC